MAHHQHDINVIPQRHSSDDSKHDAKFQEEISTMIQIEQQVPFVEGTTESDARKPRALPSNTDITDKAIMVTTNDSVIKIIAQTTKGGPSSNVHVPNGSTSTSEHALNVDSLVDNMNTHQSRKSCEKDTTYSSEEHVLSGDPEMLTWQVKVRHLPSLFR
jgi:hypothetical protein